MIGLWLLAALNAGAAQTPEADYTADVELVQLDVGVRSKSNGFVSGLNREDFRVFEDGKPRPIRYFDPAGRPATLGLVLDWSGSMRPRRREAVTAAMNLLYASHPNDEVFVVLFNEHVTFGLPNGVDFTDDRQMLLDSLSAKTPEGRTALFDALLAALRHTEKGRPGRKVLVVVSDGADNASGSSLANVLEAAKRSATTIYTVGMIDELAEANPRVLAQLAEVSGGLAYRNVPAARLAVVLHGIADDVRSRYTIGFEPSTNSGSGKYRRLRVTAGGPGRGKLIVQTRTGYYRR